MSLARLDPIHRRTLAVLIAGCGLTLSSIALPGVATAADLGAAIASPAECAGDLATLRDQWWDTLQSDPDSLLAHAILIRWNRTLADAPTGGPTAGEWRALADRTKNGWNHRRMTWRARDASRTTDRPWSPEELGLLIGSPRRWLGIGPFGRSSNAELYQNRPALLDYDRDRREEGTYGSVEWRELPVPPSEPSITPSRISWRSGGSWILRSRFRVPGGAEAAVASLSTRGSARVLLDGRELATIDRDRHHLPRVVRIPMAIESGAHTLQLISDGSPIQILFTSAQGDSLLLSPLDPAEIGPESGWRARPDLELAGLPDLSAEPESDRDRAARTLIAIAADDRLAVDRLFPEQPIEGADAVPMGIAAEQALTFLPWLPSEVTRSRIDRFRAAALAVDPHLVPVATATARTLASEDKTGEAMRALDALLEQAPRSLAIWGARESIARDQKWRREREISIAAMASIDPDHTRVLRVRRRAAEDLGRRDLVFAIDRALFEADPGLATASPLTRHYPEHEDFAALGRLMIRLAKIEPESIEVLRMRSRLARRFGEEKIYRETLLPQWIAWQPDDPSPWDDLADLQIENGLFEAAIASLEKAAQLDPGDHSRATRLTHLRAGSPIPGNAPTEAWESEMVTLEEILASAPPPGSYPGANAVLLFDQMVSDVTAEAGITEMVHQVIRLESQQAVDAYSTLPTSGEVREIAVITPDGRRLEPTGGSSGGGYTLPGLTSGALIEVRTVRRQSLRSPEDLRLGPFYFQDPDFQVAFHRSEWVVRLPVDWEPEIVIRGGAEAPVESIENGVRRIAWRVDQSPRPEPEPLLPPTDQVLPNVQVRAPLPWSRVLPDLAGGSIRDDRPTPTLMTAAAEILDGIDGTRAKVGALYNAVCERITTGGGGGGSATAVWLSRDGDRDLLLAGLLRAASIPYRRVYSALSPNRIPWVDWSNPHDVDFQAELLEVTDDAGTPLWLHIPARLAPMGRLPREIHGGRALRLTATGGEWFTLPTGDRLDDAQALIGTVTLAGNPPIASLDGGLEIRPLAGSTLKEQVKNMPPFVRSTMVEQFVQRALPGSKVKTGKIEHYDERDAPLRIAFDIEAPTLIQNRDGVPSLSSTILPNQLRATFLRTTERSYPIYSPVENTSFEALAIELGDFRPIDLPSDIEVEGPWGRFTATSRLEGSTLHLERLLDLRPFLVGAERWEEFSEFCRLVDRREEMRISLEIAAP